MGSAVGVALFRGTGGQCVLWVCSKIESGIAWFARRVRWVQARSRQRVDRAREQTLTSARVDWVSSDAIDAQPPSSVAFQEGLSGDRGRAHARPCGMECALFNLGGALPPRRLLWTFFALRDLGWLASHPCCRLVAMRRETISNGRPTCGLAACSLR